MNDPSLSRSRQSLDTFLGVESIKERPRWVKVSVIAAVVVLLGALLAYCFGGSDDAAYFTQEAKRGDLRVSVSATGNVAPTNQVDVGSELSGLVEQVLVDDNDRVVRGQVLAILDTSRLDDAVIRARAGLSAAQAQVVQARASRAESPAALSRLREVSRLSGGKVPAKTGMKDAVPHATRERAHVDSAVATLAQAPAHLHSHATTQQTAANPPPTR